MTLERNTAMRVITHDRKMPGRVETYTHSDSHTLSKGCCVVRVLCETDFAAKTDEFKAFAARVARLAYATHVAEGVGCNEVPAWYVTWESVVKTYPEMAQEKADIGAKLRESVTVDDAVVMTL